MKVKDWLKLVYLGFDVQLYIDDNLASKYSKEHEDKEIHSVYIQDNGVVVINTRKNIHLLQRRIKK